MGGTGAYVNLVGRGDICNTYVAEIPPGGQLNPERHMHDELIHVVAGRGATTIELPGGSKQTFEWAAGALFGIPLNAKHQHFNGSGTEPARFAAITNLPIYLNLTHNTDFIYNNDFAFDDRAKEERFYRARASSSRCSRAATSGRPTLCPTCTTLPCPCGTSAARAATT